MIPDSVKLATMMNHPRNVGLVLKQRVKMCGAIARFIDHLSNTLSALGYILGLPKHINKRTNKQMFYKGREKRMISGLVSEGSTYRK